MPARLDCPAREILERFLLGHLTCTQAEDVEQHLQACAHCLETVSGLDAEDPFVEAVRLQVHIREPEKAVVNSLLRRVRQLPAPAIGPHPARPALRLPEDPERTGPHLRAQAWSEDLPSETAAAPPDDLSIPGYEILSVLGRGGMGVVYKARQTGLNRLVALKMISAGAHAGPQELARFRAEAESVALLQHPNIVQIYEINEHRGHPYLALEYVEGRSLDRQINGTPQNARSAATLVHTLARAMATAHARGVIHRDLKPANVLLTTETQRHREDNQEKEEEASSSLCLCASVVNSSPKIADFGLAKQLGQDAGQTGTNQVLGTPSYMAPEQAQARHREIGPAADIYALGAILYELLTGRPPFKAATLLETLEQVRSTEPVLPRQLQPRVPRDLETICLKCLHKEPGRRYLTADLLADDLQHFLAGEPIRARPVRAWERAIKWAKRRPAAAAVLVLLIGSALAAVAGYLQYEWQGRQLAEQQLQDLIRLEEVRGAIQHALVNGRAFLERGDFSGARAELGKARALIDPEPKLADFRAEADRLLAAAEGGMARQQARADALERYRHFSEARKRALFQQAQQATGLVLAGGQEVTRGAARQALALFGIDPEKRTSLALGDLPYGDAEKADITAGCYELLLILAEATAQPLATEDRRRQVTDAAGILEVAAKLRTPTRAYHQRRANYLEQLGNGAGATQERQAARGLAAADAQDHFLLGDEAYQRRAFAQALASFSQTLRLQPDHFWAQYFSGVCFLRSGQPAQAVTCLTACQAREPELAWIPLLRGFAYGELSKRARSAGRRAEAEQYLTAAEADFQEALHRKPDALATYNLLVNRGVVRQEHGRLAQAVQDYQAAIRLRPTEAATFVNLAQVYRDQKDFPQATAQLDEALRLQPHSAGLYRTRAYFRIERQDLRQDLPGALRDFEEAIRLEPPGSKQRLAEDHTERGLILVDLERPGEALQAYDRALAIYPEHASAHRFRGGVLLKLKRYAEAAHAFDEYMKRGRPEAPDHAARAVARTKLRDYVGAVADYSRALDLEPGSSLLYARRGWTYVVGEAPGLALHDFQKALELDPNNADAYTGRGYALAKLHQYRPAVVDASRAMTLAPSADHRLAYNAARVYALVAVGMQSSAQVRHNYEERALELLRLALERLPSSERAHFWQDPVLKDNALRDLQGTTEFMHLTTRYLAEKARQTMHAPHNR
jgi:eukaryotic-like serine/threonine-protein kinase